MNDRVGILRRIEDDSRNGMGELPHPMTMAMPMGTTEGHPNRRGDETCDTAFHKWTMHTHFMVWITLTPS